MTALTAVSMPIGIIPMLRRVVDGLIMDGGNSYVSFNAYRYYPYVETHRHRVGRPTSKTVSMPIGIIPMLRPLLDAPDGAGRYVSMPIGIIPMLRLPVLR